MCDIQSSTVARWLEAGLSNMRRYLQQSRSRVACPLLGNANFERDALARMQSLSGSLAAGELRTQAAPPLPMRTPQMVTASRNACTSGASTRRCAGLSHTQRRTLACYSVLSHDPGLDSTLLCMCALAMCGSQPAATNRSRHICCDTQVHKSTHLSSDNTGMLLCLQALPQ